MGLAAERLIDWRTARLVGARVAGAGTPLTAADHAQLIRDFDEVVPEAEAIVREFTHLEPGAYPSRPNVMSRKQWLEANVGSFERILEPFARKVMESRAELASAVRRRVLGAQVGALLGYLGRRVLGQYDAFAPPDDDGSIYLVGANIAGVERKFGFPERRFRLWLSLHEVCHRLQFGGVPWMRGYMWDMVEGYLTSVELDPRWLLDRLQEGIGEILRGGFAEHRGLGWFFILLSQEQRQIVRRIQAFMSLLEGHATFVMNSVVRERMPEAEAFHRRIRERRTKGGAEGAFHKVIGFDVKIRQYDLGERFVTSAVRAVGMDRFNRIWSSPANLPTMEEIARPEDWVARVAVA